MDPADTSHRPANAGGPARPRLRLDADTLGIGAVLAALGICCVTTLAATGVGAGIMLTLVGLLTGFGWLALLLVAVALAGTAWSRARRRRAARRKGAS
ncbi:MAG: hypothetical protein M0Z49_06245 [Chloroflexi bacterium]|nr:hypothetical protein [Chloroflexota bacterium]